MRRNPATTTIVVPVFNEQDNIFPLVRELNRVFANSDRQVTVYFVDDSPGDETWSKITVARFITWSSALHVDGFRRQGSEAWGGLSGAVIDGIIRADTQTIVVMDGDLQHPASLVPDLLRQVDDGYQLAIASRYVKGGSNAGLDGGIRVLVSRVSTYAAKVLFPIRLSGVTDPMTGFFAFNREYAELEMMNPQGFKILLELIVTQHGFHNITEVPLRFGERHAGESKGDFKQGLTYMVQLMRLRLRWKNRSRPLRPPTLPAVTAALIALTRKDV